MQSLGALLYMAMGIVQFVAAMDGLNYWLGSNHLFISFVGGLIIAYTPFVGTIVGVLGAIKVWHWGWVESLLLFFGPFLSLFVIGYCSDYFDKIRSPKLD